MLRADVSMMPVPQRAPAAMSVSATVKMRGKPERARPAAPWVEAAMAPDVWDGSRLFIDASTCLIRNEKYRILLPETAMPIPVDGVTSIASGLRQGECRKAVIAPRGKAH
ncbi:MAG: hypothetical protein ABL914_01005 [Novosphingobium sp.]|uniref:hypothetical protein n=1 Tax=Novosphingobium sp. TaxID=1874826 RepID=UPI0032BC2243